MRALSTVMTRFSASALLALAAIALCAAPSAAWTGTTISITGAVPAGRAPVMVLAPSSGASKNTTLPLVMVLQSRCQGVLSIDSIFHFTSIVDTFGFVMVVPEAGAASGECGTCPGGVLANLNCRAWNATPACCSPAAASASTSVDDGAYLESVITAVSSKFTIDSNRVYVAGLDAGGFMAYHMACAYPDKIAAVMSLNGAMYNDMSQCGAFSGSTPVSVLEVHGLQDTVVPYSGGLFQGKTVPGALASASAWAAHNGCASPMDGTPLELMRHGPLTNGPETAVLNFPSCNGGAGVTLWSIKGLHHDVSDTTFTAQFAQNVLSFFQLHPKGGLAAATPVPSAMNVNALAGPPAKAKAPAPGPRRAPGSKVSSPPPPSLLSRIRASLEGHPTTTLAPAPAPARTKAHAPAPSPAMDMVEVNALSGPPSQGVPPAQVSAAPAPATVQMAKMPPPMTATVPPPMTMQPSGTLTSADVMAILSNPAALNSLIGGNLAANTALPSNIKNMLADPAVQAVLTAAASSPNPGQFITTALSAAGLDLNTLLGLQAASAPAPSPMMDANEPQRSDAFGPRILLPTVTGLAAAAIAAFAM